MSDSIEIDIPGIEQVRLDLERAAVLIKEKGHCKHAYIDNDGRLCIMGAIRVAVGFIDPRLVLSRPEIDGLIRENAARTLILRQLEPGVDESIASWNDDPERTADEVIALLRRAAKAE